MHKNNTGGSTHRKTDNPPVSRRSAAARPLYGLVLISGLLAGCQTFSSHGLDAAAGAMDTRLLSPLAASLIDSGPMPRSFGAPLGSAAELLARPDIELEPLPPPRETDLLARLRSEFSLPETDDPAFKRELEWFAKHPEYLERVLLRADRYLFHITEELEARGMPLDLALLPFVESAFDPFAYSHGRASGLWQIIPGTGKRLGLKQNWWFDGRRDVLESTRAALDYLESLAEQFDGDWLLAVAGYNSGEGNVARALKRAAAAGRGNDFWSLRSYLPRETRTYVPRLLAIRTLVAAPEAFELQLPELANEPHFAVVETGGQIDMALAADLAGIDRDRLYHLNAGFNRWATDPEGPHRLLVPVEHAEQFATALAELGERPKVQWTRHKIAPGDTLSGIAGAYDTTPAVLRQINNLRSNTIRAGDFLMIPHALESLASYAQSAEQRAARQRNEPRSGERRVHVVQRGESLWSISRQYGVGIRALAGWNAMAPGDTLSVGRELVVWTSAAAVTQTSAVGATAGSPIGGQVRRVNYVVRRGDSLSSIAQRFRVTVGNLKEWNAGLSTSRYLQPGDRLVMFVDVTEQST